ncbi:hypothetical protein AS181_07480 [Gordonia sp. SGD-V-85]|nr:hypothetical protein AS181_07480 [Gordonia sp. SGD-V-85]SCC08058.1 hypothetical protein GA0061091_10579 [Gordonia sp. v-85]
MARGEVLVARFFVIADVVTRVGSRHADTLADDVLATVPTGVAGFDAQSTKTSTQSTRSDAQSTGQARCGTSGGMAASNARV